MADLRTGLSIVTDTDAFFALQDEWNALWSEADGRHNQSFRFCWLSWIHVARPAGHRLHCITYRENGRLLLVWPLVSRRKYAWTVLDTLTPGTAEHTSILAADHPRAAAAVGDAWHAATRRCGADILYLPYVSRTSPLHGLASAHAGVMRVAQDVTAMAMLRGEADWRAFCDTLGKASGKRPGTLERRLARAGRVEIRNVDSGNPDEYLRWVEWILSNKRDWAERVNKKGKWLYSPGFRSFLADLFDATHGEASARLFVLTLNDAPVVAGILVAGHSSMYLMIAGFDPRYARYRPGAIMVEHVVRWSMEHGLDLDFGVGAERFKAYWSRRNVQPTWSFEIANTSWGRAAFYGKRVVRAVAGMRSTRQPERQPEREAEPEADAVG